MMSYSRKLTIWMLLSAATASAAFAYFHFGHKQPPDIENAITVAPAEPWQSRFDSALPAGPSRPVYPYSVIPGGVSNVAELRQMLKDDPQLAAHLKDFDLNKAVLVRAAAPRAAYVSYRVGNHIFWTTRKLTIARGEALITDGKRTIRGRCGNDISDVPLTPLSASVDPTPREFDTPVLAPVPPPEIVLNPSSSPFDGLLIPPPLLIPPSATPAPNNFIFVPPIFGGPSYVGPSVPAPTSVPEPPTFLLLSLGGAVAGLFGLWTKRKRSKASQIFSVHL
jgi:hypothetical protein